jgi:transposase
MTLFWLSDAQWAALEPLLPQNQPGAHRVDDRRVLSGIVQVLKTGCRWRDCPSAYGPPTTVYNRYRRWAGRGLWRRLFQALVQASPGEVHLIDSTHAKAHRSAAGGKGGRMLRRSVDRAAVDGLGRPIACEITGGQLGDLRAALAVLGALPPSRFCVADAAYDSNGLRPFLMERGTVPVIPNNPTRRRPQPFDPALYRARTLIERMFCRLKDFRRVATRYDKLAATFEAAVLIAAIVTWWT